MVTLLTADMHCTWNYLHGPQKTGLANAMSTDPKHIRNGGYGIHSPSEYTESTKHASNSGVSGIGSLVLNGIMSFKRGKSTSVSSQAAARRTTQGARKSHVSTSDYLSDRLKSLRKRLHTSPLPRRARPIPYIIRVLIHSPHEVT